MTFITSRLAGVIVVIVYLLGFIIFPYSAGKHIYLSPNFSFFLQILMISLFVLNFKAHPLMYGFYILLFTLIASYIIYFRSANYFHINEALMAFIPALYLALISGSWKEFISKQVSIDVSKFIFISMPLFYLLRIMMGVEEPGFLLENNLEIIIFISSAFVIFINYFENSRPFILFIYWLSVCSILLISDAIGHLLGVLIAFGALPGIKKYGLILLLFITPFIFNFVYELLLLSDRYVFLSAFLDSFHLWPQAGFELNSEICKPLSSAVMMYERMGYCSSVMFHGSVPRIFYDFGLLFGFILCFMFYISIYKITPKYSLSIFVYLFVSGIFISIFNSSLFLLGIFLLRGGSYDFRPN